MKKAIMNEFDAYRFVLRRCFWWGKVSRGDILEAFECSDATATRWLQQAFERSRGLLIRQAKYLKPVLQAAPPTAASSTTLFTLLTEGRTSFAELGLRNGELESRHMGLKNTLPPDDPLAAIILKTLVHQKTLDVRYVGLRKGEQARWRTLAPVSLELFEGQWRLHAHDLADTNFTLKSFVLNRILETRFSEQTWPKKLKNKFGAMPLRRYRVILNGQITDDQRFVLRRELNLDEDNILALSDSAIFDFRRQYMESEIQAKTDIVWPLVSTIEAV